MAGTGAALRLCALLSVAVLLGVRAESACQRVRAAFQAVQPGAKWMPESPGAGEELEQRVLAAARAA